MKKKKDPAVRIADALEIIAGHLSGIHDAMYHDILSTQTGKLLFRESITELLHCISTDIEECKQEYVGG